MPFRCRPSSPDGLFFVIAIFIGHIPIREDDDSGRQSFPLPSLFRIADFEVDVVAIFELLVKGALKPVSPLGVVLNNPLEVVEELAVRVYLRYLNIRTRVANEITLKKPDGLQTCEVRDEMVERLVQFEDLLKELEFHSSRPPAAKEGRMLPASLINPISDD
jgi:hypothetical protein